jgi:hypothetical protein
VVSFLIGLLAILWVTSVLVGGFVYGLGALGIFLALVFGHLQVAFSVAFLLGHWSALEKKK